MLWGTGELFFVLLPLRARAPTVTGGTFLPRVATRDGVDKAGNDSSFFLNFCPAVPKKKKEKANKQGTFVSPPPWAILL